MQSEESKDNNDVNDDEQPLRSIMVGSETKRVGLLARLRTYFLTGLVIAAPIAITAYITWWFISLVDEWIKPYLPEQWNPDTYLQFSIPGVGLVVVFLSLIVLGALTANLFGRTLIAYGEQMMSGMPVVRNIYKALKQIFETALSQSGSSFKEVALIEYPRKGIYSLVFISTTTKGEVLEKSDCNEMLSVFLPTTPNPTSGYLLFVPRKDIIILNMSVEEAAKMVISAGLVAPASTEIKKKKEEKSSTHAK